MTPAVPKGISRRTARPSREGHPRCGGLAAMAIAHKIREKPKAVSLEKRLVTKQRILKQKSFHDIRCRRSRPLSKQAVAKRKTLRIPSIELIACESVSFPSTAGGPT